MNQANEPSTGILYVCGTPIGNLKDASPRLLEVLSSVDAVLCEDTRRTLKLLSYFGLRKKVISFYEHVEKEKAADVVNMLRNGKNLALVSDAGMPCISDPGSYLVKTVREQGLPAVIVPGPSSVTAAVSISGFPAQKFIFAGFPPRKTKDKEEFFREWIRPNVACVFYESPVRLKKSLASLVKIFPHIDVSLCHELTKVHEEVLAGKASDILKTLDDKKPKGEWVMVAFLRDNHEVGSE